MQKKVVVYGNTILSQMLYYDSLQHADFQIVAFTVDEEYLTSDTFLGLPQVDFTKVQALYPPHEYDMIAVRGGYTHMRSREVMYLRAKAQGYTMRNYISPTVDTTPSVSMGENNIVFGQTHLGIGGSMGSNNIIRQQVYIGHDFRMNNNNVIGVGCRIGGNCQIEDTCYFGLGAVVVNNTKIAKESLVGAGSVVIRHTEPYSKNVGNPSRVIGYHEEDGICMKVEHE